MIRKETSHGDKSIHNLNADLYGCFTTQNRRKHSNPLFRKHVWM